MGDRLTQLQDAVDEVIDLGSIKFDPLANSTQLAQQFVACLYFVNTRHDLETLGPADKIREEKKEQGQGEGMSSHARPPGDTICELD